MTNVPFRISLVYGSWPRVVSLITAAPPAVSPDLSSTISGWLPVPRVPANVMTTFVVCAGPPVTVALFTPTVDRPWRAVWIAAAVAVYGRAAVVWPLKVRVNVPADAPDATRVCTSATPAAVPADFLNVAPDRFTV